jgi:hypothetical protein
MLITPRMDLGVLAEVMGPAADRADAFHMLDALEQWGLMGQDTADVPEPTWSHLLDMAAEQRAALDAFTRNASTRHARERRYA